MALRDFRLLLAGSATSLLGDQFVLIATPWLTLSLTGDPLALGLVLALEGIPRAAFMLIGGAATDRFSPRRIMLMSDVIRLVLTAALAAAALTGNVQLWMIYVFSLGFGLVAGFAIPAQNSIVPMIVTDQDLQAGNSLIMGVTQLAGFIGPSVAGAAIAAFSESLVGVGLAFSIDAATFAGSIMCLLSMRGAGRPISDATDDGLWHSIGVGVRYLWGDASLRTLLVILVVVNFLVVGPLLVGIPVLAHERLPDGATAFGALMGAFAVGNLIGYILAGSTRRPSGRVIRTAIVSLLAGFGTVLAVVGFVPSVWIDFGLLLVLGLGNGYLAILLFTWVQQSVPEGLLGRVVSLITFSSLGLVSVSQALSGAVSRWSLDALLVGTGMLVLVVSGWVFGRPELSALAANLSTSSAEV